MVPRHQDVPKGWQLPQLRQFNNQENIENTSLSFLFYSETLYKRSHDEVLWRSVDALKANKIMDEIHKKGRCGPQMSAYMLAKKILRQWYYWLTIKNYSFKHIRKCHLYQIHANKINQPPTLLHNMTSPCLLQCGVFMELVRSLLKTSIDLVLWPLIILWNG